MAAAKDRGTFALKTFVALSTIIIAGAQGVPPVKIQAFKPRGFQAYIEDTPYLDVFAFHGNVNKPIEITDVGTLAGEAHRATDGKWIVEDAEQLLKVGDVINYYVFVSFETVGYFNSNRNYLKENQSYTIQELDLNWRASVNGVSTPYKSSCGYTLTKIYGGRTACAGQTIFEDNFDSTLNEDNWLIQHYIPIHHNDEPFVSYQRLSTNSTVTVSHGKLRISPTLQHKLPWYDGEFITSGNLSLIDGCTSEAEECFKAAKGDDIIPPVVSGRITSNNFAFKYGTIYVRAKIPIGDWLYPEMLLEPVHKYKYGSTKYASGVLKVAGVRGNMEVNTTSLYLGNKVLYGGYIVDQLCRDILLYHWIAPDGGRWGDDFHIFSLRWDPDGITLGVDGKPWAYVLPWKNSTWLVDQLGDKCKNAQRALPAYHHGSKLSPFDDYFYIALGVIAGGNTEFRDNSFTGINKHPKPWTNGESSAMLKFWQDLDNWYATWERPELLIDYVRVDAL